MPTNPEDATIAVMTAYLATNPLPANNLAPLVNRVLQVFERTWKPVIQSASASVDSPVVDEAPKETAVAPTPELAPEPAPVVATNSKIWALSENSISACDPKESVFATYIRCLHCGDPFTVLTRHIRSSHGQLPDEYRRHFSLPEHYPMTVPDRAQIKNGAIKRRPVWKAEWAAETPVSN